MKTLLIGITCMIGILLISCRLQDKQNVKVNLPESNKVKDSIIHISLFNLRKYSDTLIKNKRKFISKAMKQSITEHEINDYDERPLSDFYILDIDKDGDNDIIYSSLVDQYRRTDRNGFYIFENNHGRFIKHSISGYLYSTNLFEVNTNKEDVIFMTVMRPCCDYSFFTFFITKFNFKTWKYSTIKMSTIEERKVDEIL